MSEVAWEWLPFVFVLVVGVAHLLFLMRVSSRPVVPAAVERCPDCEAGVWHRVFVTSPPGWGSVMPCSQASRAQGVVVRSEEEIAAMRAEGVWR